MVYAAIWASWLTSEVSHILYILSEKDCSRGEKLSKNETILAEANKCLPSQWTVTLFVGVVALRYQHG